MDDKGGGGKGNKGSVKRGEGFNKKRGEEMCCKISKEDARVKVQIADIYKNKRER